MPTFTPKADLLYQDGSTPRRYCVIASFDETEQFSMINSSEIEVHTEESDGFVIQFTVGDNTRSNDNELEADLGTIPLVTITGFVDVDYYDEQQVFLGRKRIRTEEAQKDTRPIEPKK